ncbi:MAG: hypothetical protein ACPG8W_08235 [Candidatus Promineifilaceae bacterium]
MSRARFLQCGLVFTLFFLFPACSVLPFAEEEQPQCFDDTVLFSDSFAAETVCGWALFNGGESAEIIDGVLRITAATNGLIAWSNPGYSFTDSEMTVQTRQLTGPNDNAYGVICRYLDDENFYIFLISGDGYYAIGKYQTGISQIQYLTGAAPDHYIQSDVISQGATLNQLRVRCVGNRLSMYANGTLLTEVEDSTFTSGDIGVAAGVFDAGRLVVEFDNVQVTNP